MAMLDVNSSTPFLLNAYREEVVEVSICENCLSRNGQSICSAAKKNTNLRQPHLSIWCAKLFAQARLMTRRQVIH
jgi:hypothetical protein